MELTFKVMTARDGEAALILRLLRTREALPPSLQSKPTQNYHSPSAGLQRDWHGRIKRSEAAKHDFMRQSGHPHGWAGHVVDHINPLKRGGCDCPANMQWQTIEEAKAKDRWE